MPVKAGRFCKPDTFKSTEGVVHAACHATSGLRMPICLRRLSTLCVCACDIKPVGLSAIASQPFHKWPRHEVWWKHDQREKLHYVRSASLAYEDRSVFMSGPFRQAASNE